MIKVGESYGTEMGVKAHIGGKDKAGYYVGKVFVSRKIWIIAYHNNGVVAYVPTNLRKQLPDAYEKLQLCVARFFDNAESYNKAIKIAKGL